MYWDRQDIVAFLQHSYSKFKYRNVGLIAQLVYELQVPFKEVMLWTWEDIYMLLDDRWSDNLLNLLEKQKETFGFQPLIAPQVRPIKGAYVPYTKYRLSKICRKIIHEAPHVRKELKMRYLPIS